MLSKLFEKNAEEFHVGNRNKAQVLLSNSKSYAGDTGHALRAGSSLEYAPGLVSIDPCLPVSICFWIRGCSISSTVLLCMGNTHSAHTNYSAFSLLI